MESKILVIVSSGLRNNAHTVARVFAGFLEAPVMTPEQIDPEELRDYDLIGFGSGIDSERHHRRLLTLADELPMAHNGKAFIFSACGTPGANKQVAASHEALRRKLHTRGFTVVDEFNCARWQNDSDLERAADFAVNLLKKTCA